MAKAFQTSRAEQQTKNSRFAPLRRQQPTAAAANRGGADVGGGALPEKGTTVEPALPQTLTQKEFDILVLMAESGTAHKQRQLADATSYSLATVNRTLKDLDEKGYQVKGSITPDGLAALEPYRAKRAIFIAAGFGSRLVPVTLNTPKPLVRVNGKRIIDGLLDACLAAGINEIYVVRGYLAEQFELLRTKYPMVKFLENPLYNEANNISSALVARFLLSNAYVFEADLLISNPSIVKKYHYTSEFLAIPIERSDDWCFTVKDGVIVEQKIGGLNCHQMVGISYWNAEDGALLSEDIAEAYAMPGGKEFYWEQVALKVFKDKYRVHVQECAEDDIIEIDTYRELKAIDKTYDV